MSELVRAASHAYYARVRELLLDSHDAEKEEALRVAAVRGCLDVVRHLVKWDAHVTTEAGDTALMWAAAAGQVEVVQFLAQNCYVNVQDDNKDTALMLAAQQGHLSVVRCLVEEFCANVSGTNVDGESAMTLAAKYGHYRVVWYLVNDDGNVHCAPLNTSRGIGDVALLLAARYGYLSLVVYLTGGYCGKVDGKDANGDTALIYAAKGGHLDVVRYLVTGSRVDVDVVNAVGDTALIWAARRGHVDVVQFLTDGCDAETNEEEEAAVEFAGKQGYMYHHIGPRFPVEAHELETPARRWWRKCIDQIKRTFWHLFRAETPSALSSKARSPALSALKSAEFPLLETAPFASSPKKRTC